MTSLPAQKRECVIFGPGMVKNSIRSMGVKLASPDLVFAIYTRYGLSKFFPPWVHNIPQRQLAIAPKPKYLQNSEREKQKELEQHGRQHSQIPPPPPPRALTEKQGRVECVQFRAFISEMLATARYQNIAKKNRASVRLSQDSSATAAHSSRCTCTRVYRYM